MCVCSSLIFEPIKLKMYRNKRYRIGASNANASSISNSSTISTISNATIPPITSTPKVSKPAEPVENVLREANALDASQSVYHSAAQTSQATQPAPAGRIASIDEDFQVPASQFVQQSRYISQRSVRMRTQLSMTQQTPMSYFESVLSRCGIELTARNSEISYTLNCDHLKFVIRLRKELKSHSKYPENVQNFLSGLIDSMKNQTQLVKVLSGCMVRKEDLHQRFFLALNQHHLKILTIKSYIWGILALNHAF